MSRSKNITDAQFEFYLAMKTDNDNFSAGLARLMLKADQTNFAKLNDSFPDMAEVVFGYQNVPDYWERLQAKIKGHKADGQD